MKRLIIYLFVMQLGFAFGITKAQDYGVDGNNYQSDASVGLFYSSLSPFGSWIQLDGGLTVWRPLHLRHDWAPYRNGHWVWTDDGWYWDSYDPFGYVVFHYGRWYYDNYYGWIWVPDNVWAPAWVEWRYNDDYIGWAPLPPYASFSFGFGISFTNNYVTPYSYWHFVNYRYMCDSDPFDHFVPERYKYRIYSDSRYRTNYGYSDGRVINRGVDVDFVRQRSGGRIVERQIERTNDPRNIVSGRNTDIVRAFIPSREQLTRNDGRNFDIKRGSRPSTIDLSRIAVDSRDNSSRNNNPWIDRNNQQNSRNENQNKPREVTPQPRNENPWIQRNTNPNTRNESPWIQRNTKPETRNENPFIQRNPQPNNRNENPWIQRNNRTETRSSNPWQQRTSRPEVRQENRGSRQPEVRKENNRGSNNQKRNSGNRERH